MEALPKSLLSVLVTCVATFTLPCFAAGAPNASVNARLESCDRDIVRSAADEMLHDPETLREPLLLFHAAGNERRIGDKEQAAFLFLAARLRSMRHVLFEQGERPQLLAVMLMSLGPQIAPTLLADRKLAGDVVARVIEWDRVTPDPYRDRKDGSSTEVQHKLAELDARLAELPDQTGNDPHQLAEARSAEEQTTRRFEADHAERCGPGTLDSVDIELVDKTIQRQAETLAKAHPVVLRRAAGTVESARVTASKVGRSRLPSRLTVSITPAEGKSFYAEVDAEVAVTPDRKLDSIRTSVVCITDLSRGQRDASWKDVCRDDPRAVRATPP